MKSAKQIFSLSKGTSCLLAAVLFLSVVILPGCKATSFLPLDKQKEKAEIHTGLSDEKTENPQEQSQKTVQFYNRYTGLTCDEKRSASRPLSICLSSLDPNFSFSETEVLMQFPDGAGSSLFWALSAGESDDFAGTPAVAPKDTLLLPEAFHSVLVFSKLTDRFCNENVQPKEFLELEAFGEQCDEGSSLDTTWKSLREIAKIKNYSLENTTAPLPFRFADKPGYNVGNPIGKIEFSAGDRVSVSYRKSTGQYETSLSTSSSLSFSNVILLLTNVNGYYSPDKSETSLDLSAGGKGFCYTGGGSASFSWSIQDGVLSFTCEDGSPLTLNPGKTYIAALKVTDCASISAQ